jgi:hypothetical protein
MIAATIGILANWEAAVPVSIISFSGSSSSIFGIPVYGRRSEEWWFKALLRPIWKAAHKMHRGLMWLRYRLVKRHKYHLIDTRLPPHYYDIDTLMLHGMFSLLRRYVEDEHEGVDALEKWGRELVGVDKRDFMMEATQRQGNKELEAVALYRWWTESLPAMEKRKDELMSSLYGRDRIQFNPVAGGELFELSMTPFEGDEVAMEAEMRALEDRIDREEQEMLHRLIDTRRALWT